MLRRDADDRGGAALHACTETSVFEAEGHQIAAKGSDSRDLMCKLAADTSTGNAASSDIASQAFPPPSEVRLAEQAPFVPTSLRASGRTWAPMASVDTGQPTEEDFDQKAGRIVEEMARMLRGMQICKGAFADWQSMPGGSSACTFLAYVASDDTGSAQQMTATAKEAIFSGVFQEKGVVLLGWKGQPFSPTPQGFGAVLGKSQSRRWVCRKFYELGCCPHGSDCKRLHPVATMSLNFVVVVSSL